eukprot:scaffold421216_cov54-Attheya_sp.AAC.2
MGLAGKLSPLEPSSFGFEILTTQLVKCALAAALTVPKNERPTLKEIFTDNLGFELPVSDESNASTTVNTWFTDFPNLIPIRPKPLATKFYYTQQHRMAATVKETDEGNVGLLMDEEIGMAAKSFECEAEDSSKFSPPFCSLAYGNSHLNDGYVTFFTQPKDNPEEKPTKVTVQNQSKDFLSPSSTIDARKISEQVVKCSMPCVVSVFGRGLFCVSSKHAAWSVKDKAKIQLSRSFVGFAIDSSKLLPGLLGKLEDLRNKETLAIAHGELFCDTENLSPEYAKKALELLNRTFTDEKLVVPQLLREIGIKKEIFE